MKIETYPSEGFPERIFNEATLEIANYMVSFVVNGRQSGSATLTTVDGVAGFLTAAHVIDDLLAADGGTVEVICMASFHRFSVLKRFFTVVKHGPTQGDFPGPDLAFVQINDPNCIGTLKAKKSFLPITANMAPIFSEVREKPSAVCCLAGMPAEFSSEEGVRQTASHRLVANLFFGRTQVMEEQCVGDFRYLTCEMFAGAHGFPMSYGGVSGGAIWHIPLCIDPERGETSLHHLKPELLGVAFFQRELRDESRAILAHSHESLWPSFHGLRERG
jgi:hypothetical protein